MCGPKALVRPRSSHGKMRAIACVCVGPFRMQIQLKLPKSAVVGASLFVSISNPAQKLDALALSRKAALCADLKHCGACLLIKYKLHSFIIERRSCCCRCLGN